MRKISTYYLLLLLLLNLCLAETCGSSIDGLVDQLAGNADISQLPYATRLMIDHSQIAFLVLCAISALFLPVSIFTRAGVKAILHVIIFIVLFDVIVLLTYFINMCFFSCHLIYHLRNEAILHQTVLPLWNYANETTLVMNL